MPNQDHRLDRLTRTQCVESGKSDGPLFLHERVGDLTAVVPRSFDE